MVNKKAEIEVLPLSPLFCLSDWPTFAGRTSALPVILTGGKDKEYF